MKLEDKSSRCVILCRKMNAFQEIVMSEAEEIS